VSSVVQDNFLRMKDNAKIALSTKSPHKKVPVNAFLVKQEQNPTTPALSVYPVLPVNSPPTKAHAKTVPLARILLHRALLPASPVLVVVNQQQIELHVSYVHQVVNHVMREHANYADPISILPMLVPVVVRSVRQDQKPMRRALAVCYVQRENTRLQMK